MNSLSDNRSYKCPICMDLGYVVEKKGEFATAKVCRCSEHCDLCDDFGFVIKNIGNVTVSTKCQCRMMRDRIDLFNAAKVPARYSDKTLERYVAVTRKQGEAKSYLMNYRDAFSKNAKGILLYGPTGVGKTHLATGLIRYLTLEKGVSARFVEFFALLQEIKATFSTNGSEVQIIEALNQPEVLVIDELGKGRATDWEKTVVDSLIARRYNSGKTVVITTNYDVNDKTSGGLADRVGKRVMSRLYEMCEFFAIDGQDYRRNQ